MSGKRVEADPEKIEAFANGVDRYLDTLISLNQNLKSQLSRLSESWQDQKFAKFREEFSHLLVDIDNFVESASDTPDYLRRKAEILRKYLEH